MTAIGQQVPINIVGSSVFGRYPKISLEKTTNMFISDDWLINYAGFKARKIIDTQNKGRGLFYSVRGDFMIAVIGSNVYRIDSALFVTLVNATPLNTSEGDVYIDENLLKQICIVDGENAWIYDYDADTFRIQIMEFNSVPFKPSYVCYHNSFFLFGSSPDSTQNPSFWYVYQKGTVTPDLEFVYQFSIQTKPDVALVVKRLPGRGNNILVVGNTVAEVWTQVSGAIPYSRVSSFNIDNGIVSQSTLAASEDYMCWLSQNENNAPFIMVTNGSSANRISTDGIDHLLGTIKFPEQSDAFFYRQDGHLFYQLTFYNVADNLTLLYDFSSQKFFNITDDKNNYHPARQIAFFNKKTYFVSINNGVLYEMGTNFVTYDYSTAINSVGEEIPRSRICKSVRKTDSTRFKANEFIFWLEQGQVRDNPSTSPRVDMTFSKDGNQSFSNVVSRPLNSVSVRRNKIRWNRMGQANEFTIQLRFLGFEKFVANDGTLSIF